jgi:hypothetical protein
MAGRQGVRIPLVGATRVGLDHDQGDFIVSKIDMGGWLGQTPRICTRRRRVGTRASGYPQNGVLLAGRGRALETLRHGPNGRWAWATRH